MRARPRSWRSKIGKDIDGDLRTGEVREIRKAVQSFIEDASLMEKKCVPRDPHDQIRHYFSKHKLAVIVSFEPSGIGFALNICVQSDD
jgi:hypothetical protein